MFALPIRRKSTFVRPKSILKLPKLNLISEEDENVSENSSPERTRKESDGSNSENFNSKPEADQLEMKTYPSSGESTECVLQCSECEPQDEVDGVTFAPLPVMTKCQDDVENEFEIEPIQVSLNPNDYFHAGSDSESDSDSEIIFSGKPQRSEE